jgi:putative toxin-antitoxin system antitoxin component (TIGR02293 family)
MPERYSNMDTSTLEGRRPRKSAESDSRSRSARKDAEGAYWFVSLIGLRSRDPIDIFKHVEKGLAFTALERFQRSSGISTADLADAVVITVRTLHRRREQGRLEPDESDRLLRVSRVFGKALDLFEGQTQAARRWLFTPQRALGGKEPIVLAKTDVGAREVEALVDRLEHGVLT